MEYNGQASALTLACTELARQYSFLSYGSIGKTILQNEIPYLQVGKGKGTVLLIGGAYAADRISEPLLLHFAEDLCRQIAKEKRVYGISCPYLYENRSIWILPRLNPDGHALSQNGADPSCPLYERQLRMNQMKSDFSTWQGNARGVIPTLNFGNDFAARRQKYLENDRTNYPPCGEYPESEPESMALSRLIYTINPIFIAEFSVGSSHFFTFDPSLSTHVGKLTGFSASDTPDNGICTWFSNTYHRPALYMAFPHSDYSILRSFLFRLPTLLRVTV